MSTVQVRCSIWLNSSDCRFNVCIVLQHIQTQVACTWGQTGTAPFTYLIVHLTLGFLCLQRTPSRLGQNRGLGWELRLRPPARPACRTQQKVHLPQDTSILRDKHYCRANQSSSMSHSSCQPYRVSSYLQMQGTVGAKLPRNKVQITPRAPLQMPCPDNHEHAAR